MTDQISEVNASEEESVTEGGGCGCSCNEQSQHSQPLKQQPWQQADEEEDESPVCGECGTTEDLMELGQWVYRCPDCAAECAAGEECHGERYYKDSSELNAQGLCQSCEEVAPPGPGEFCEWHPDEVAIGYLDGNPACEECLDQAYPSD